MPRPAPNARARGIQESVTLAIAAKALELRAAGKDVLSLGAGEPDFPTPEPISRKGIEAIEAGNYRYTAPSGMPALRQAAAEWFGKAFGLEYSPDEVMVTAGAKPALHMALNTAIEPGDRVLILAPFWVSYPALVRMADGVPVIVPPAYESGFVHDPALLRRLADEHDAKGILVNYPNNPTGAVATREQITALVEVASERDMWILSDEIYALLTYEGRKHVSPAAVPGGRERTMVVSGFTKSHTLTGWRIGFLAGNKDLIAAAGRIQSQVLGNPCTISQAAALAACAEPPFAEPDRRNLAFDERRSFLLREINAIEGLHLAPPHGAFYALIDARAVCESLGIGDVEFCEQLLEEQLLATVPGSAFGADGFVRVSYAAALPVLEAAVARLRAFVTSKINR